MMNTNIRINNQAYRTAIGRLTNGKPGYSVSKLARCFALPGMHSDLKVQSFSKGGEFDIEAKVRYGPEKYYRQRDNLILTDIEGWEEDPHSLRPHPRDDNDKEFSHALIYGYLRKSVYRRLMDKQAGVDDQEVVIDVENFRFRDAIINHFRDISKPIEDKDWFIVNGFYWIMGYFAWILLKQIGRWVRQPYLEAKKRQATKADEIERKRIEEEKVNSQMVLKSRPPQLFSRFDYGQATTDILLRKDELDRLMKDPIKKLPNKA